MMISTGWGSQGWGSKGHWHIQPYGDGKYRLFIKLCEISLVKDIFRKKSAILYIAYTFRSA